MNKRLRKKLHLAQGKVDFLRNSATFFCGEKKIVEYYQLVHAAYPQHPLLHQGGIKNGRFRFKKLPHTMRGVPLRAEDGIQYAHQLVQALLDNHISLPPDGGRNMQR